MIGLVATVVAGIAGGAVAGALFFGGLAATVRRLPTSPRPASLVTASLLGRLAVVTLLLAGLAALGAPALLAGIAAVLAVRWVMVRRVPAGTSSGRR